jgi:membrane-associated phospholipid phosphatase
MMRGAGGGLVIVAALAVRATPLAAQEKRPTPPLNPDSAQAPKPLFTRKDAIFAAAFAATTVAMFPLDERLAKHLTNPGAQANKFFNRSANGVEAIASPGAYYIGGTMYLVGRVARIDRLADLGWHGTEAVLVADFATYVLKGTLGRSRPFVTADTNAHDFKPFKGFRNGNRQSFPSGHATSAFAAAAAVTAETGTWWPKSTWVIGPVMYGGATSVALSRMYHNRHWASDVVLGAAVGTFAGWKVVQYSHTHHTRIDRFVLHTAVLPDGAGGVLVVGSATLP